MPQKRISASGVAKASAFADGNLHAGALSGKISFASVTTSDRSSMRAGKKRPARDFCLRRVSRVPADRPDEFVERGDQPLFDAHMRASSRRNP